MSDDRPPPSKESPSQTAGPYVHIGCLPNDAGIVGVFDRDIGSSMLNEDTRGERIRVTGCIYDGADDPLRDAVVEIWQADAAGLYASPLETRGAADPGFGGFGRQATDPNSGEFRFETIKPGPVPYPDGRLQAPHITLWIVARGINIGLHTRLYFDDEGDANAADPLLQAIEPGVRASTLLAKSTGNGDYRFDIYLQGENETVFLDL